MVIFLVNSRAIQDLVRPLKSFQRPGGGPRKRCLKVLDDPIWVIEQMRK